MRIITLVALVIGQHYTTIIMSDCYTFNWKKVIFILLEKLNTSGGYFFSPDQNLVLSWDKINGDHRVFYGFTKLRELITQWTHEICF